MLRCWWFLLSRKRGRCCCSSPETHTQLVWSTALADCEKRRYFPCPVSVLVSYCFVGSLALFIPPLIYCFYNPDWWEYLAPGWEGDSEQWPFLIKGLDHTCSMQCSLPVSAHMLVSNLFIRRVGYGWDHPQSFPHRALREPWGKKSDRAFGQKNLGRVYWP